MQRCTKLRAMLGHLVVPLAVAFCCGSAAADEAADVNVLLQSRKHGEALSKADAFLKQSPRDARMRFLKGLVLADMGRRREAVAVFDALTADFPAMPEPYNNLAVLYAADGRYDDARVALENAIRANPEYTKAYENLGDIYATLATQRYSKMLQQDPDNAQVRLKYLMVRSALDNAAESMPKAPPKPVIASAELPVVASAAPSAAIAAPATPKAASAASAASVASTASSAAVQSAQTTQTDSGSKGGERELVLAQVNAWADAWSGKNFARYLSFYSTAFKTEHGESRRSWEAQRRSRILKKDAIQISVESPSVSMKDGTATVSFTQRYVSGKMDMKERKVLQLQKADGQWKIVQERVES